jgi:hypothetical protein
MGASNDIVFLSRRKRSCKHMELHKPVVEFDLDAVRNNEVQLQQWEREREIQ